MRLNDATPADWDRLRKAYPAIEKEEKVEDSLYNKWIDPAMEEAHEMLVKEGCTLDLDWGEDVVNKPSHYNSGGVECIEAIEASMELEAFQGYLKGNILKYIWRMSYKGKSLVDCKKAQWYLNKLISTLEDKA
tara:strand:- start:444 stop:842 length:399 start_codon:yes stop_codon:yes gene_type:complete